MPGPSNPPKGKTKRTTTVKRKGQQASRGKSKGKGKQLARNQSSGESDYGSDVRRISKTKKSKEDRFVEGETDLVEESDDDERDLYDNDKVSREASLDLIIR